MRVALFPTCVVELTAPGALAAARRVLARLGVAVDIPAGVVCCGQPAFNSGHWDLARPLARDLARALGGYDAVVLPSGSCATMCRTGLPELLPSGPALPPVYEFSEFLTDVLHLERPAGRYEARGLWLPSCHLARWLGRRDGAARLLAGIDGLVMHEPPHPNLCCGFGGTFAVHFPELSAAMADEKLREAEEVGADVIVGSDASCLVHLATRAAFREHPIAVLHIAELLDRAGVGA